MSQNILNPQFLSAFLLVFVCLFFGFFLRRRNLVGKEAKTVLKTVIWDLALPCMAFSAFMQDFFAEDFRAGGIVLLAAFGFYFLFILIGKLLFSRLGKDASDVASLLTAIGQLTLFTMPLVSALGLTRATFYCGMMTLAFRFVLYFVAYPMIASGKGGIGQLKKVLLTPVMLAMLLGLAVWLTQGLVQVNGTPVLRIDLTLPAVYAVVRTLSSVVCPLSMIMVGLILGESDLKSDLSDKTAWAASVLHAAVFPALIFVTVSLLSGIFDADARIALVLGFAAPSSATVCAFAVAEGKEEVLSSRIAALSVLLSLVFIPVFTLLLLR